MKRFYVIIKIFVKYSLYEFFVDYKVFYFFRLIHCLFFWKFRKYNLYNKLCLGRRLRLALEELGPVWIKFGQMLSTRKDIFSDETINELSMLQDHVKPIDNIKIYDYIEKLIGKSIDSCFYNFQEVPLASASIAQIHTAVLKENNTEVVIKVIRPNILLIINSDICLMYKCTVWIERFFPHVKSFFCINIVKEYEKIILREVNMLNEVSNALIFRKNFINSDILYFPKIYTEYCNNNIIVMERIYGIPISNISYLKKLGVDMKLLAERGINIFLTQILRDRFFHADMHPGNIFIDVNHPKDPKYISIDFGIVGYLNQKDQRFLVENLIALFNRDYKKVALLHLNIYLNTVFLEIDLDEFEDAIRNIFDPIFQKKLSEISFGYCLISLFKIYRQFNIKIQPKFILLQKTILYVEGIGHQLYPELNLWKIAKPFVEKWIKQESNISTFLLNLKKTKHYWLESICEVPMLLHNVVTEYRFFQQKNYQLMYNTYKNKKNQNYKFRLLLLFNLSLIFLLFSVFCLTEEYSINYIIFLFCTSIILWWCI